MPIRPTVRLPGARLGTGKSGKSDGGFWWRYGPESMESNGGAGGWISAAGGRGGRRCI